MSDIELKPCPFCGGSMEPIVMCIDKNYYHEYIEWLKANGRITDFREGYSVHCYHCGARTSPVPTREEAAEKWNRRDKRHKEPEQLMFDIVKES